jgi:dual specificity tyrosine-phosphorylation-regulated kinase 2/3/4
MVPEDVLKHYGKHLSQYERDEIMDYDMIYYLPLNAKNKGVGQYVTNELTC